MTAAWCLTPPPAHADARARARRAFEEGLRKIDEGDFSGAIRAFEEANQIVPHPDVQYNLAYACMDAGRFEDAVKWFEIYLSQPSAPDDAPEVQAALARIKALIARTTPSPAPEPPPITGPPAPPLEVEARDLASLREIARSLRGLSPEKAELLDGITRRLTERARVVSTPEPQPPPPPPPIEKPAGDARKVAVRTVDEYREQEVVVAATRQAASPDRAPAVVWVITQRELLERGYETLADALRAVAGLHVIDDHVFVDVGVRGVHAGQRGMSRILKVLVNGQPVSFRPTAGNLLGLEAIPLRAVERLELIRGPASALYGANAFLGVLSIITRKGGDLRGAVLTARASVSTGVTDAQGAPDARPSGAGDAVVGTAAGGLSVLLAASQAGLDRSGLGVPLSSPLGPELARVGRTVSVDDTSSPLSLFGSVRQDLGRMGQLTLESGFQRLHARGEWLDVGLLSHDTRIVYENLWARVGYDVELPEGFGLSAFTAYGSGGPGDGHRFRPLRAGAIEVDPSRYLVERFSSSAVSGGLELRYAWGAGFVARLGADVDVDRESLRVVDTVFTAPVGVRQPGDRIPVPGITPRDVVLTNVGAYAQVSGSPAEFLDVIGGFRFDAQNRYGSAASGRLGAVARLSSSLYVKALYGGSFRAPAPDQIFFGPAYLGDALGCDAYAPCRDVGLKPQVAHTGELVLGATLGERLEAQVVGYLSVVDDFILSFPNVGGFFVTTNAGSYLSRGLELELKTRLPEPTPGLRIKAHLFGSLGRTTVDVPTSQFSPPEAIRDEFRRESLFPPVSGGFGVDVAVVPAKLGLYVEGRVTGPRRASGSNLAISSDRYVDGSLPGYFVLDLNLSTRDLVLFNGRETMLSVRVTNVAGALTAEPGFRGWDIPGAPREIGFRWVQEL